MRASKEQVIFISYRRSDSSGWVGRLSDDLSIKLRESKFFYDIDSIRPGADFADEISRTLKDTDCSLIIIGPNWINSRDENGQRRLEDPEDYVRLEIKAVLDRNMPVIPVLVGEAKIPSRDLLPETLRTLTRRNAVEIRDNRWKDDVDHLANELRFLLGQKGEKRVRSSLSTSLIHFWLTVLGVTILIVTGTAGYLWWQHLRMTPASPDETATSDSVSQPVDLTFVNSSNLSTNVFWINYDGNEVRYCSLAPNQACSQRTYKNHRWVARSPEGRLVMEYIAGRDGSPFVVHIR